MENSNAQSAKKTDKKKKVLTSVLAAALAASLLIGGGTYAYLQDNTDDLVNNFDTNKVLVSLDETTGNEYEIIPGTENDKDPKVTVDATVDSYVYLTVTDETQGLVDYEIDTSIWTPLGDDYPNVYYHEVTGKDEKQELGVLVDDKVSYDKTLVNDDMLDDSGNLKEGIKLTFQASAIQKEPFNDPVIAYIGDAGWDGVSTEEITAVDGVYTVENEDQLAYLSSEIPASELKGKTIKLAKNMYMNNHNFPAFGVANDNQSDTKLTDFTFDGNGYVIKNLMLKDHGSYLPSAYVQGSSKSSFYFGLFCNVDGTTTLKNIDIDHFTVWGGYNNGMTDSNDDKMIAVNGVGTLVGNFTDDLTIENCDLKNGRVVGIGKVGGLVGFNASNGYATDGSKETLTISNSSVNSTTIYAMYNAGGAVGLIKRPTDLSISGLTIGDDVEFVGLSDDDCYVDMDTTVVDNCSSGNSYRFCDMQGAAVKGKYWNYTKAQTSGTGVQFFSAAYAKYFNYYGNTECAPGKYTCKKGTVEDYPGVGGSHSHDLNFTYNNYATALLNSEVPVDDLSQIETAKHPASCVIGDNSSGSWEVVSCEKN